MYIAVFDTELSFFFPSELKSNITNSEQSRKSRMKYKSWKLSKHESLEKPEVVIYLHNNNLNSNVILGVKE
jgi:hypothetical protein